MPFRIIPFLQVVLALSVAFPPPLAPSLIQLLRPHDLAPPHNHISEEIKPFFRDRSIRLLPFVGRGVLALKALKTFQEFSILVLVDFFVGILDAKLGTDVPTIPVVLYREHSTCLGRWSDSGA